MFKEIESMVQGINTSYKSPVRKLVNFFENSRNAWKEKFQRLKIKYRNLERRHEYASNKIKNLKQEIKNLQLIVYKW